MITPKIIRTLVNVIYFLDQSGDDIVQPDAAVTQIDTIAADLQELSATDQKCIIQEILRMADEEEAVEPAARIDFLRSLPAGLGLE